MNSGSDSTIPRSNTDRQSKPAAKNPYAAAALNVAIWGLGYLYLGRKTTFTMLLTLGGLLTRAALFIPGEYMLPLAYQVISDFGFLMINLAFAYDAYRLARGYPAIPAGP